MITNAASSRIGFRWLAIALPMALCLWIAVLAGVMRVGGAPAALVMFPADGLLGQLPQGVSVTSIGPYSMTVRGGQGLVAALYQAGAVLVLPAGLTGCLPQTLPL